MAAPRISRQMATLLQTNASLLTFFTESTWAHRISLTASDEMIERGLPVFAAATEHAHTTEPPQALPS